MTNVKQIRILIISLLAFVVMMFTATFTVAYAKWSAGNTSVSVTGQVGLFYTALPSDLGEGASVRQLGVKAAAAGDTQNSYICVSKGSYAGSTAYLVFETGAGADEFKLAVTPVAVDQTTGQPSGSGVADSNISAHLPATTLAITAAALNTATAPTKYYIALNFGTYSYYALDLSFTAVTPLDFTLTAKVQATEPGGTPATTATVSFSTGDGGSAVAPQTVTVGEMATRPATDPTRTGYVFVDWYTSAECTTAFDFDTAINADTTVHAGWGHNVTFDYNYDSEPAPVVKPVLHGKTIANADIVNGSALREHNIFLGWFHSDDAGATLGAAYDPTAAVTADVTVYAGWQSTEGGVVCITRSGVDTYQALNDLASPTGVTGARGNSFTLVAGDVLTYYNGSKTAKTLTAGALGDVLTLSDGKATVAAGKGGEYVLYFDSDDKIYVAYNVSFKYNYTDAPNNGTYVWNIINIGETATCPATAPTRPQEGSTEYMFAGWYTTSTGDTLFDPDTAITSTTDIYAKWLVKGWYLRVNDAKYVQLAYVTQSRYSGYNEVFMANVDVEAGDKIEFVLDSVTAKPFYVWSDGAALAKNDSTAPTSATITADGRYTMFVSAVNGHSGGVIEVAKQTVDIDLTEIENSGEYTVDLVGIANDTVVMFKADGSYVTFKNKGVDGSNTNAIDETYYAYNFARGGDFRVKVTRTGTGNNTVWNVTAKRLYTVTYKFNDGTEDATEYVVKASNAAGVVGVDGKIARYYTDSERTTPFSLSTAINADTTVYVDWGYTVTYHLDGGNTTSQVVAVGGKATRPDDPTKATDDTNAYMFYDWYTTAECTTLFDFDTAINSATDVYARWIAVPKKDKHIVVDTADHVAANVDVRKIWPFEDIAHESVSWFRAGDIISLFDGGVRKQIKVTNDYLVAQDDNYEWTVTVKSGTTSADYIMYFTFDGTGASLITSDYIEIDVTGVTDTTVQDMDIRAHSMVRFKNGSGVGDVYDVGTTFSGREEGKDYTLVLQHTDHSNNVYFGYRVDGAGKYRITVKNEEHKVTDPDTHEEKTYTRAVMIQRLYEVTFDANGGEGAPTDFYVIHGQTFSAPETEPTMTGYTFVGWYLERDDENTGAAEYLGAGTHKVKTPWAFGDWVIRDPNVTLYAGWGYTVTFNLDGATINDQSTYSQKVLAGGKATRPTTPWREKYWFADWYTSDTFATVYDFDTAVNSDITLYALELLNGGYVKIGSSYLAMDVNTSFATDHPDKLWKGYYDNSLWIGYSYEYMLNFYTANAEVLQFVVSGKVVNISIENDGTGYQSLNFEQNSFTSQPSGRYNIYFKIDDGAEHGEIYAFFNYELTVIENEDATLTGDVVKEYYLGTPIAIPANLEVRFKVGDTVLSSFKPENDCQGVSDAAWTSTDRLHINAPGIFEFYVKQTSGGEWRVYSKRFVSKVTPIEDWPCNVFLVGKHSNMPSVTKDYGIACNLSTDYYSTDTDRSNHYVFYNVVLNAGDYIAVRTNRSGQHAWDHVFTDIDNNCPTKNAFTTEAVDGQNYLKVLVSGTYNIHFRNGWEDGWNDLWIEVVSTDIILKCNDGNVIFSFTPDSWMRDVHLHVYTSTVDVDGGWPGYSFGSYHELDCDVGDLIIILNMKDTGGTGKESTNNKEAGHISAGHYRLTTSAWDGNNFSYVSTPI